MPSVASSRQMPDAVLLVGGKGTRLQSVVSDRPKALAEVAGSPFLDRMLHHLAAQGIQRTVLCTGFGAAAIAAHAAAGERYGLAIEYSNETVPLGTGGALRNALPLMHSNPVLILNADSWCTFSIQDFLAFHHSTGASASMLLGHVEDRSRYGSVSLDAHSAITGFHEKNTLAGAGWINAGVYLFSLDTVESIPAGRPLSLETEVFPALTNGFYGWRGGQDFIDIGTPESYSRAQQVFAPPAGVVPGDIQL